MKCTRIIELLLPLSCWYPYFMKLNPDGCRLAVTSKLLWVYDTVAAALFVYCDFVAFPWDEASRLEDFAAKGMTACLVVLYAVRHFGAGSIRRVFQDVSREETRVVPTSVLTIIAANQLIVVYMTAMGVLGSRPKKRFPAAYYFLYSSNAIASVASQYFLLLSAVSWQLGTVLDLGGRENPPRARIIRMARTGHSIGVAFCRRVNAAYGSSVFLYVFIVFLSVLQAAGRLVLPSSLMKKLIQASYIALLAIQGLSLCWIGEKIENEPGYNMDMRGVVGFLSPLGIFPYGLDDEGRSISLRRWSLAVLGLELCATGYNYVYVIGDRLSWGVTLPGVLPMFLSTLTLSLAGLALARLTSTAAGISRLLALGRTPRVLIVYICLFGQTCLLIGIACTGLVGTVGPGFRAYYMGILCLMHLLLLSLTVQFRIAYDINSLPPVLHWVQIIPPMTVIIALLAQSNLENDTIITHWRWRKAETCLIVNITSRKRRTQVVFACEATNFALSMLNEDIKAVPRNMTRVALKAWRLRHLEVTQSFESLMDVYRADLLVAAILQAVFVVLYVYVLVNKNVHSVLPAFCNLLQLITVFTNLIWMCARSTALSRQASNTSHQLFKLDLGSFEESAADEANLFFEQIDKMKVEAKAYNIITFNMRLAFKTTGLVATYVVLFMQLKEESTSA